VSFELTHFCGFCRHCYFHGNMYYQSRLQRCPTVQAWDDTVYSWFVEHMIREDLTPDYGDGFRQALAAYHHFSSLHALQPKVQEVPLKALLQHVATRGCLVGD
jgi:hypothetical protein